jgi:hypothetical protein
MFKLLKYAALGYAFLTIGMFVEYGFWWTMSVLWMSSMVLFFTVVGQLPILRKYYFFLVVGLYIIIFTTSDYWGIQDPQHYRIMQATFIPMGYIVLTDLFIDSLKDIISEIFGNR